MKHVLALTALLASTSSFAQQSIQTAETEAENCTAVYAKLLNADPAQVQLVSVTDLSRGSYNVEREVIVSVIESVSSLTYVKMKTQGDFFCSNEKLIAIEATTPIRVP